MQRREFIHTSIRYFLLALLGILSLTAFFGKGDKEECIAGNICNSCGKSKSCNLPQNSERV